MSDGANITFTAQWSVLPTTSVLVPSNGATVVGSTTLDASATNATGVSFVLFGGTYGLSGQLACTATLTANGWVCAWNTESVPDDNYTLVSYATNAAGGTASAGVTLRVNNTNALPSTSILLPSSGGMTLSGTTTLDASATNATGVGFVLFGGTYGYAGHLLCTAGPSLYGYLCSWNTASVPNGTYILTSVATNSAGTVFSTGVSITVEN